MHINIYMLSDNIVGKLVGCNISIILDVCSFTSKSVEMQGESPSRARFHENNWFRNGRATFYC